MSNLRNMMLKRKTKFKVGSHIDVSGKKPTKKYKVGSHVKLKTK